MQTKTKLKLKNKSKRKSHWFAEKIHLLLQTLAVELNISVQQHQPIHLF